MSPSTSARTCARGGWLNSRRRPRLRARRRSRRPTRRSCSSTATAPSCAATSCTTAPPSTWTSRSRTARAGKSTSSRYLLDLDRRRIPFEGYRDAKKFAAEKQRFFCWAGVAPFEQMHPVCGHEYMLMGMALDPDWVKDMVNDLRRPHHQAPGDALRRGGQAGRASSSTRTWASRTGRSCRRRCIEEIIAARPQAALRLRPLASAAR